MTGPDPALRDCIARQALLWRCLETLRFSDPAELPPDAEAMWERLTAEFEALEVFRQARTAGLTVADAVALAAEASLSEGLSESPVEAADAWKVA